MFTTVAANVAASRQAGLFDGPEVALLDHWAGLAFVDQQPVTIIGFLVRKAQGERVLIEGSEARVRDFSSAVESVVREHGTAR